MLLLPALAEGSESTAASQLWQRDMVLYAVASILNALLCSP